MTELDTPQIDRLRGTRCELQRIVAADVEALLELWSSSESAQAVWPRWTRSDIEDLVHGIDGQSGWWITVDGERVGFIQSWEDTDPEYRHAGMDIFLVERAQGKGAGTDAVRTLARHLIDDVGHHRLVIDPAADNERAIRTYEKVGFRRVGVLREYELGADGTWHDNVLMDMLAREL